MRRDDVEDEMCVIKPKQAAKVHMQALICAAVFPLLADQQEEYMNSGMISETQLEIVQGFCEKHAALIQGFSADAILDWTLDYRRHGSFALDMRGRHERNWLLQQEDLVSGFQGWMITHWQRG